MRKKIAMFIFIGVMFFTLFLSSCSNKSTNISDETDSLAEAEEVKEKVFATGFNGADGITIDSQGNMYVGNRKTNVISKVDIEGKVKDFVTLQCDELLCMTADKENNIYAAGKDKVFKISPNGEVTELATDFTCADDLRIDEKGNIYVTDSFENRVYKITPQLEKIIFINSDVSNDSLGDGWHITGITFDNSFENLYIARMKKGQILKYPINEDGSPGNPTLLIENLQEPDHLEIDKQNRLYITLFREGSLIRIDDQGNVEHLSNKGMKYATGIVLGKNGFDEKSAYVADYGRNKVYKIKIDED